MSAHRLFSSFCSLICYLLFSITYVPCLSVSPLSLSPFLFACMSVCLYVDLSVCLCAYVSRTLSLCLSLYIYLSSRVLMCMYESIPLRFSLFMPISPLPLYLPSLILPHRGWQMLAKLSLISTQYSSTGRREEERWLNTFTEEEPAESPGILRSEEQREHFFALK